MPRTRQVPVEGEPECSDAASRASSQEERSAGTGTPLTAETFRQTILQLQQSMVLQQQQFLREIVERMSKTGGGAPRITEDAPQTIERTEEPFTEQPLMVDLEERVSPVTIGS